MPLLKKRNLRPRLVRALHRELENPELPIEQRHAIEEGLDDPKLIEKLNNSTFILLKKNGKLEPPVDTAAFVSSGPEPVKGPFLDWLLETLKQYMPQIIAALLKLLGV